MRIMSESDESKSQNEVAEAPTIKMEVDRRKPCEEKIETSRNSHRDIEKRRRDKMNQYINDLATMIPMPPSIKPKPDKLTVLRLTVQHMKALQGTPEPLKETNHKPGFLSDDDLRNLITEASGGFLIVVECARGQVLYVTDSVQGVLNITQADVVCSNFYDLVHSKDVANIKTQLSTTPSDSKKGENNEVKYPAEVKKSGQKSDKLCPGAKRSFLCRMKKGVEGPKADQPFEVLETSSNRSKTKPSLQLDENNHILTSFEGYLKSWPQSSQTKQSNDPSCCCCLVAIGRAVHVHDQQTNYSQPGVVHKFETRHRADGVFVRVDKSFTTILGYCPDEVIGKSPYSFFHKDDLKSIAGSHQQAIYHVGNRPEVVYRFRAKAGHYVPVKTSSVAFRNPWTKEVDYIIAKNTVMAPVLSNTFLINEKRILEKECTNSASREETNSESDQYNLTREIRDMLKKLESLDSNEGQSRKRTVGSSETNKGGNTSKSSPDDIGVLIAEQAKKYHQTKKLNPKSPQYSNAPLPGPSAPQPLLNNWKSKDRPPSDGSSRDIPLQTTDITRPQGRSDQPISRLQSEFGDGIMMEQLAGIEGAVAGMDGNEPNGEDDDGLSSLMLNVIANDEELRRVLNDMQWNFL